MTQTHPLHDPVIRLNYYYAVQLMAHLTVPMATTEDTIRVHKDIRGKLHDCLLQIGDAAIRRRLRIVAADLGVGEISTLFPAQPITDTPEVETVDAVPLLATIASLTRDQLSRLFAELVRITSDPDSKYRRSAEVIAIFRQAGDAAGKAAAALTPALRQAVREATEASRRSGEHPLP